MADLTTVDGYHMTFDPSAVIAAADHDAGTGAAVTCIYGLTAAQVHISETVAGFLARVGIAANFAQFTRPSGFPVWVNAKAASLVRAPLPGEYAAAVQAVVSVGSLAQGVEETVAAVTAALKAHGGNF
ncbi:MAG: hypothetical protein ABSD74_17005 [Rhizomicrobium sp.]|jgi:hypothetical protein